MVETVSCKREECRLGSSAIERRITRWFFAAAAICGLATMAQADVITFGGAITQSTQDGTGPAVNNPVLNQILDGDPYLVRLGFAGSISGIGTYNLTGGTLLFSDSAVGATESSFSTLSLTVSADGAFYDMALMGCLTTGSGCTLGNELTANFKVLSGSINSQNVPAQFIPGLIASFELLEDDGITDIQGGVNTYSDVPEPSSVLLFGTLIMLLVASRRFRPRAIVKL